MVCGINRRMRATLVPRTDKTIRILSSLGEWQTDIERLDSSPDVRFVMAAVRTSPRPLSRGFDLRIESGFSHRVGFGSSAAVTVATLAAIGKWLTGAVVPDRLFEDAVTAVREVQGLGSGADVAASVHGGLLRYRAAPVEIERLAHRHALAAVYSGSKTPTPEVVARVEERRRLYPRLFDDIFDAMDQCATAAARAASSGDWRTFGLMMNTAQGLMDALGVNTARLAEIVYALRGEPGILGSKISGSGLGDCAVGLGATGAGFPFEAIGLEMAEQGVAIEQG